MASTNRRKLGDLLLEYNLITDEQLQQALAEQKKRGERLGQTLVRLGFVTRQMINEVLEFQLGIPTISLLQYPLHPEVFKLLPESLCRRHKCLPVKRSGNRLTVAMVDPLNLPALDDIKMTTNLEIDAAIVAEDELEQVFEKIYGLNEEQEADIKRLEVEANRAEEERSIIDLGELERMTAVGDAPIIRVVNTILQQAAKEGASDIHLEPQEGGVRVRYRADGILRHVLTLPKAAHPALLSRIKLLAKMNIAEKRLPQDGRIQTKLGDKMIDMRVSTLPAIHGEKCVIRLLDKSNVRFDLRQLGFRDEVLRAYEKIVRNPYGMILITGPTGSGKTTTLYASIHELNTPEKNIVTVEDPVEYVLDGVNQVQVNMRAGLDFASGLRSILRQDPDVILVGEIRDRETAEIGVRAATTGHLVFSTLHTNDAAGSVNRLVDMGVEPFLVASSLVGVVAQRLVRRVCANCKRPYTPERGSPERIYLGVADDAPLTLFRGRGCVACNHTGYKGRLAIHEVLTVTAAQRKLILERASADAITAQAICDGMIPIRQDGMSKVLQGLTTVQEILRVADVNE
ncbi:type ii secretion system protein e, putative [Heliomicrobium modesticaldum Ice1]|uniref:Type ii secretion system protein e, putative n=1 Tax=Heliobacterium modesticaldum (strain ATCC 51547 / Ice1) TaxID=498761 RepID=B0TEE9_HELMI|nr:ATPase, T2SS/T4P/T4SS family [Heliomicrobium modesticaldum]ABZ82868.1 type ii secretion system protein e, putative [Heliomicrobium modesticaldum Ice1]